eukprot:TRINITY_DN276_c0_g1_i2.p1 TRINITY_DN276_c0_g1~~TRINITY_DN276_c0_g1_i2.p1  ORF type:complete len:184 (+),score=55.85 TRINITY_DN276_c0_g1_i2:36-554(+)
MSETLETFLKRDTIGYLSKDEFSRKKSELETKEKLNVLVPHPANNSQNEKKKKRNTEAKLSFLDEEEDVEQIEEEDTPNTKKRRSMKNPDVNTSFLKKNKEEEHEEAQKLLDIKKMMIEKEDKTKNEPLDLEYTFMLRPNGPLPTALRTFHRKTKFDCFGVYSSTLQHAINT